jgi:hypothetical protein
MHIRTPACKGAWYDTDESAAAHGPHEFFPDPLLGASRCPGWSDGDARATDLEARLRSHVEGRAMVAGVRLEVSPAVLAELTWLTEPSLSECPVMPAAPVDRLYGVPIVATRMEAGTWRLLAADGTLIDTSAVPRGITPDPSGLRHPLSVEYRKTGLPAYGDATGRLLTDDEIAARLAAAADGAPPSLASTRDWLDTTTAKLARLAVLQQEHDLQQQVIWLLVHRLGGTVRITDDELAGLPAHLPLAFQRDDDGIGITAEPWIAPPGIGPLPTDEG